MTTQSRSPFALVVAGVVVLAVGAAALSWFYLGGTPSPSVATPPVKVAAKAPVPAKPVLKPAIQAPHLAEEPPPDNAGANALLSKLSKNGKNVKLTPEQLQTYLMENKRNAESLLIASRVSDDPNLLREAAKLAPGDPRVQFELATRGATDGERRAGIQALKQAAPDNAMGDYLSAMEHFKSKDPAAAMEDIKAAMGKARLEDYASDNLQGAEEAYLAAGYSATDAKTASMMGMQLPQIQQMNDLSTQLSNLQQSYLKANDAANAETVSRSGLAVAQQMQNQLGSRFILNDMVGIAMESRVLAGIDPSSVIDDSGITARQRIEQLNQRRAEMKELSSTNINILQSLPPRELMSYFDRAKIHGEASALRWLRAKYPK
ncbi:MAG: hypothetical protein JWO08_4353 [Verrucomicrobiaceae bacterium]|nr:hypothetical protein [Verrucomicrobiaceae bacterium]